MSSKTKTLQDLLHHQLKDLHSAERQAAKMWQKMAKAAEAPALKTAFEARSQAAGTHLQRVETMFAAIDKKPNGTDCEVMEGLVTEAKALIDDFDHGAVLDAGLVAAAQAIEHYEVARYTAIERWADALGLDAVAEPASTVVSDAQTALGRWGSLSASADPSSALTLKQAALIGLA